jgi:hypothetical protein
MADGFEQSRFHPVRKGGGQGWCTPERMRWESCRIKAVPAKESGAPGARLQSKPSATADVSLRRVHLVSFRHVFATADTGPSG